MATYADLKLTHRIFMEGYPFTQYAIEGNPTAILKNPIEKCKFALITTAGLRLAEDKRFDRAWSLGDTSFRELPNSIDPQDLIEDHKSSAFDHSGIESDKNLAFPLERFREMEKQGKIGGLNWRHFSFMGSIINPKSLIEETAPQVAKLLKADAVNAVFLTPV